MSGHLADHVRRDAEHAARSDIRVHVQRFIRRMDGEARAAIAAAIEEAEASGEAVDGLEIGRQAAARAIGRYMAAGEPQPAIDSVSDELPAASPDP